MELYHVCCGSLDVPISVEVADALDIYESPYRHVLNALLLIKTPDNVVVEGLGMSDATLTAYKHLFFDVSVFRHVFAARTYVNALQDDGTPEFSAYHYALTEGPLALISRYRVGDGPPLDPLIVAADMMREFTLRAREHRGASLNSKIAQNSLRSARNAVDSAVALRGMQPKSGGQSAAQRLEFVLLNGGNTITAEDSPVPVQELLRSGPTDKPPGVT